MALRVSDDVPNRSVLHKGHKGQLDPLQQNSVFGLTLAKGRAHSE